MTNILHSTRFSFEPVNESEKCIEENSRLLQNENTTGAQITY